MPLYEYYCGKCDKTYELLQSVNASKIIECEECGGSANKIMSSFSARRIIKSPQEMEDSKYDWKDGKVVQNKKWAAEVNRQLAFCFADKPDNPKDKK